MLDFLKEQSIFVYIIGAIGIITALGRIIVHNIIAKLAKAAENMGLSDKKLLKNIKSKFETCFNLNKKVNNIDVLVDKYIEKYKILGFTIDVWEKFNIEGIIAIAGCCAASLYVAFAANYSTEQIQGIFIVTCASMLLLITTENMLRLKDKKDVLVINITDYLENYYINRLETTGELLNEEQTTDSEESIKYLVKCISEIAASTTEPIKQIDVIEHQSILTPSEEQFIEDMLQEFFAE